jgi:hypothetical protein
MEGWMNEHLYFTAIDVSDAEILIVATGENAGYYREEFENGYSIIGYSFSPIGAKLLLDTKVCVKFYFNKNDITENFTYTVKLGGNVIASGTYSDLTAEDEFYVLTFSGIGLSDFATEFEVISAAMYDPDFSEHNTIIKLAEIGAENAEKPSEKALFYAIADLGRVVKDPESAKHGLNYQEITPKSSAKKGDENALLTFTGKNLVMSDAIGIRLNGTVENVEDTTGLKVVVNGKDVTSLCDISTPTLIDGKYKFSIDIFLSVSKMASIKNISVYDQNEKLCLKLSDQVDWIAQSIITNEPENNLAKQTLIYIQKAYNYIHEIEQVVNPSTPGTEVEIGGKVELF